MLWSGLTVILKLRTPALNPSGMEEVLDESDVPLRNSPPALASLGALGGFVAGLLGVGGGIIVVPVLTGPLHIPMRRAVASSLVAVAIYQVPALATHIWLGHVNWALALPLMAGVIPGAQVGARLTIGSSDRTIRILFAFMVVAVAIVYGLTETVGLISE
jgi:uncharacterized membrane protein YfcA